MSYNHIVRLAQDYDFRMRITACAAAEGVTTPHPTTFADQIQWQVAAAPGMVEDYAYAVDTNASEHPGKEEHIITDAAILSAVQPLVQEHLAEQDKAKRVQEQREAYELSMMPVEVTENIHHEQTPMSYFESTVDYPWKDELPGEPAGVVEEAVVNDDPEVVYEDQPSEPVEKLQLVPDAPVEDKDPVVIYEDEDEDEVPDTILETIDEPIEETIDEPVEEVVEEPVEEVVEEIVEEAPENQPGAPTPY